MNTEICPIWSILGKHYATSGDALVVDSLRADGRYWVSGRALTAMPYGEDPGLQVKLTSWLIEQRRLGIDCPKVYPGVIDSMKSRQKLSVRQRANNLLRYVRSQVPTIGSSFDFETEPQTYADRGQKAGRIYQGTLAWSESTEFMEVRYLLEYLESESWLKQLPRTSSCLQYLLTVQGHGHLDEIDYAVKNSAKAFVAIWFDESLDEAWEHGILPAINDAGYEAVRIDQKEHLNKIDDEIIAEIRRSLFLVADFTQGEDGARGGVYYEAGYAHGLNIPVIFTCRKDALEKVHFDTRQFSHIIWEKPEELRDGLYKRITAVLGDGPRLQQVTNESHV